MNARLSFTACSASGTLRWRPPASVRTYAATSSAAFLDIISSTGAPLPETGMRRADMGARRHRGDIGRNGDDESRRGGPGARGPDEDTTGVEAASIRDTMARVESRSPPGVRRVKTTSAALARSARSIVSIMNSAETGWMMLLTSGGEDDRYGGLGTDERRRVHRQDGQQQAPTEKAHGW